MIYISFNLISFSDLLLELKKYIKNDKTLSKIEKCYLFANEKHKGQKRKSGHDFIIHPLYTAFFLAKWRMGPASICAGLLHDILEDTPVTFEELELNFGKEIAQIVKSITKVSYFAKENRTQIKSLYLRKLYIGLAKDIRVIIIKMADRLHNMQTIEFHSNLKQKEIAKETLDIYCPIARRIGMKNVEVLLEELSFKVADYKNYQKIKLLLEEKQKKSSKILLEIQKQIQKTIKNKLHTIFYIKSRSKTIYSIYRKMQFLKKDFNDIYDILAFRIITNTVDECYNVLGIIHQIFTPLSGRFKDYISVPKNNLYQSLHTTVINSTGYIFEIQIRTKEMDWKAEYGVAAHWRYKEGEKYNVSNKQIAIDNILEIFEGILSFQDLTVNNNNNFTFENQIKNDFFEKNIYVLTPKSKVITLPFGSTALDFAYRIHSEIGKHTIGCKINGVFHSFNVKLNSGDLVEIKTSKNQFPNRNWLSIVKTNSAQEKIKKFLKQQEEQKYKILKDKSKIEDISDVNKIKITKDKFLKLLSENQVNKKNDFNNNDFLILKKLNYKNFDSFLLDIYNKKISFSIAYKLFSENIDNLDNIIPNILAKKTSVKKVKKNISADFLISGINNIRTSIARCCMPIPYETVFGIISKNRFVKIHSSNCINFLNENKNDKNLNILNVEWDKDMDLKNKNYFSRLLIKCFNQPGIFMHISTILNRLNCNLDSIKSYKDKKTLSIKIIIIIKVQDLAILNSVIGLIKKISNIQSVERLFL